MELSFLLGVRNHTTSVLVVIGLVIFFNGQSSLVARAASAESKVHIVYLGEKQHDDPEFVTQSHHRMLSSIVGSKEDAHDSMVHSFRHGFSGFAAKLTSSQAKKMAELPQVVHVIRDRFYKLATTRTWDYLGVSDASPNNILNEANMGEHMIIGVIDTGVWPESQVFNDNGIGAVPSHWKGGCESGEMFNSSHCNKKLIGAKYFISSFLAENESFNPSETIDFISPRDRNGHGTHVASIAGGSYVPNTSYKGLAGGTLRGGAPRAHIAVYKTCWYIDDLGTTLCSSADILKAMDEAIHDGVDLLSLSLGFEPLYPETDIRDGIATGAFHAVLNGITVVCAGANAGPAAQTVTNLAPWIITVAATTLDRSFPTPLTLGNNKVILGQAVYTGPELAFTSLVFPENPGNSNGNFSGACERLFINSNITMAGKVVLCFTTPSYENFVARAAHYVKRAGGLGVIVAGHPGNILRPCQDLDDFPCVSVDYELGTNILLYIRSSGSPVVKIQPSKTLIGPPVGTKVAAFSSRGPNPITAAVLKPDIAAPGVSILAATTTNSTFNDRGFVFLSGTSMATPTISGVVALLKSLHRDWSPAAFRSAIVTTAWRTDPFGEQIFAEGAPRKLADPFDYGGGLVNPEKAAKPGLVYDLGLEDYVLYMCSVGYNESSISQLVGHGTVCSHPRPSVLDFNLPSITIPNLKEQVTLTRTLTNVGPLHSVYKVAVDPPLGVQVTVMPEMLVFNSTTKRVSFKVKVSTTHKINTGYYFGSLTWSDSLHNVTIPLSVRTQILPFYYDEN